MSDDRGRPILHEGSIRVTTQLTTPSPTLAGSRIEPIEPIVVRFVPHDSYSDPQRVRVILESIPVGTVDGECNRLPHAGHDDDVVNRSLLTNEEEVSLFERMNCLRSLANRRLLDVEGDPEGRRRVAARLLKEAIDVRNEIMLANQRLIVSIARKCRRRALPLEDLIAEANITLSAAVDAFDCHRGFRFSTYATHAVTRRLARLTERVQHQRTSESCVDPELIEASLPEGASGVDRTRAAQLITKLLQSLSPEERELLEKRFGLGTQDRRHTYAELGRTCGVSGESMRQRVARVCEKLRDSVDQYGELAQGW